MRMTYLIPLLLLGAAAASAADPAAPAAPSTMTLSRIKPPADAVAYIVSPHDGDTVNGPVTVVFGLKGMGVAPAGVQHADTGHFHLIVDADLPPANAPIPKDEQHLHFGNGQTQTTLTLKPGKHTLQLLMGDYLHMSFDPPVVSEKITITVK